MTAERDVAIQDTYADDGSWCYGCGRLNEQGLHFRTFVEDGVPVTRFLPGPQHTGARDFVYGGLIASLIDCHSTGVVAAAAYEAQGRPLGSEPRLRYVTASLKVDFVAPTPVGVELEVRGGATSVGERKVIVASELRAGDRVCAKGEVVAVLIRREAGVS